MRRLGIRVKVESEDLQKQTQKKALKHKNFHLETELDLTTRIEVYDRKRLQTLYKKEESWKFPKGENEIRVMPIIAPEKKIDHSSKDLEIRVELRVEYFTFVPAEYEHIQ